MSSELDEVVVSSPPGGPTGKMQAHMEKVLKEIKSIKAGVGDMAIRLSGAVIKTQDDYEKASFTIKEANLSLKKLERAEDKATFPYKLVLDKIKAAAKAIRLPIETGIKTVKDRGKKFLQDEQEKRDREIAKAAKAREDASRAAVEADTQKEQSKQLSKAAAADVKIQTLQVAKPTNAQRRRVFRITDPALIPREYLIPDEIKIRQHGGKVDDPIPTDVPGVEYSNETDMRG